MRKCLLFSFFLLLNLVFGLDKSYAQTSPDTLKRQSDTSTVNVLKEEPEYAETLAEFPGGESELFKFIIKNTIYPKEASKAGQQGKVYIRFVIDKEGWVDPESVRVMKGEFELLNQEAIRVIKSMPRWKPATQLGKPIRTQYSIPIIFKL